MSKLILVIEDQEDNRRIMRDLFTSAGYEVIEALTGEEGVTLAETHRPDLILMDIQLPGIDGHETTRRIRANPDLSGIAIIAVTSYALSGDDAKAFEAGCDDYVAKPFSPRALPLILIVDDNPANVEILQMRFSANNYEIITATE
jgi:two-component system cell cycle response regulator DivK